MHMYSLHEKDGAKGANVIEGPPFTVLLENLVIGCFEKKKKKKTLAPPTLSGKFCVLL